MPQTVDGFQVLRKVAESNSAEIFLALRIVGKAREGEYALKVLRPAFAKDGLYRRYLETEYRVLAGLEHPNLVRIHEVSLGSVRPFLVMDYIPGRSLQVRLSRERPAVAEVLGWLAQVADGLSYFHDHGYVHRDVKPQNIVIAEKEPVRVIDFALARREDRSFGQRLLRRLLDRRRPGTWSYMAPEQIRNERRTGQMDVYSLGVTLFECLAGRVPFTARNPQELLERHLRAPVPSVQSLRPELPMPLDDLVRAMLAKDPLDRPHGMGYVSARLRSLAEACRSNE